MKDKTGKENKRKVFHYTNEGKKCPKQKEYHSHICRASPNKSITVLYLKNDVTDYAYIDMANPVFR